MRLKNKNSILQKLVFQIRYRFGFTYLDKCGRTINTIMRDLPEWIARGEATPNGTGLVSLRNGCLFNFSSSEYGLSLEKPSGETPLSDNDMKEFTEQVVSLSSLVNDQLGLREFTRIGFRAWYLFGCSSKEESEKWLNELGLYSINEKLVKLVSIKSCGSIDTGSS